MGQPVRSWEREDKQLVFDIVGNEEQVARPWKGWLQQEARKMILTETLQMDYQQEEIALSR